MKRSAAAPPRIAKIGAPSAPATMTIATPGHAGTPASSDGFRASRRPTSIPVDAKRRPLHRALDRHTSRAAISAKPTGRTSWATQVGMPAPRIDPVSRSERISSTAPAARTIATPEATAAVKMAAARRGAPSGTKPPVASASSRPSRAAIAPPRKPTHNTRCCTIGPAPGMPMPKARRNAISRMGSTTIAASAVAATAFSNKMSARFTVRRRPACAA